LDEDVNNVAPGNLEKLFRPRTVVVVGASTRETADGFGPITALRAVEFSGEIFAVNPKREEVLGLRCFPSVEALPLVPDAAVVSVPNRLVPEVVSQCGALGIGAVAVGSAGFAEGGDEGRALQRELVAAASAHGVAVCGPNNVGVLNVLDRTALWTAPAEGLLSPGAVAVISHSGSVAMSLGNELARLGLAHIISAGNEAVLGVGDYVNWLAEDDRVAVIALFLEAIRDPAVLGAACRKAQRAGKRLVCLKIGRSETARRAIAAHSAGIAGDHAIVDAYFGALGVQLVSDLDELINCSELMLRYPLGPERPGAVVLTMSGGEGGVVADIASEVGLPLPALRTTTIDRLRDHFPAFLTPSNPLDAYGLGYTQERFVGIARALDDDPDLPTITIATDAPANGFADAPLARQMASAIGELAAHSSTQFVVLNNTSGGGRDPQTDQVLRAAGIPFLLGMREGLAALSAWSRETAPPPITLPTEERSRLAALGPELVSSGEVQRFALLRQLGLPMVQTFRVDSVESALEAAGRLGMPVVMKGTGPRLAHKTELGLVHLNLADEAAVRHAYEQIVEALDRADDIAAGAEVAMQPSASGDLELIVGIRNDTEFGSVVVVGLGGIYTEAFNDSAVALGPIDDRSARSLLERTHIGSLLRGRRDDKAFDIDAIAGAIALLSRLGAATKESVGAIEINPLLVGVGPDPVTAVDLLIEPQIVTTREEP
jgi:acetate---CoA ligase (ADP-forming)